MTSCTPIATNLAALRAASTTSIAFAEPGGATSSTLVHSSSVLLNRKPVRQASCAGAGRLESAWLASPHTPSRQDAVDCADCSTAMVGAMSLAVGRRPAYSPASIASASLATTPSRLLMRADMLTSAARTPDTVGSAAVRNVVTCSSDPAPSCDGGA